MLLNLVYIKQLIMLLFYSGLRTISMKIKSPQGGFFMSKIQSQQGFTSLISQHKSI